MKVKCIQVLLDYRHLLRSWREIYAPQPGDEMWHPLFCEALQDISYIEYLLDILLFGETEEQAAVIAEQGKKFLPFDRTGNRRFIPVQTDRSQMEVHILANEKESRAYLEQVWAKAMVIFRSGDFKLAFSREIEEELDNHYVKPKKSDTDCICDIMNSSIIGWVPGPTARFKEYGTQRF